MSNDAIPPMMDSRPPLTPQPEPVQPIFGIIKLVGGFFLSSCFCCGVFMASYKGAGVGAIMGALMGAGLGTMLSGTFNLFGKRSGFGIPAGLAVVTLLFGAFAGPPLASGIHISSAESESEGHAKSHDMVELRKHLKEVREEQVECGLDHSKAIKIASDALAAEYKAALEKVTKESSAEGTDPELRDAFAKILEDLAKAETADVHLAFTNKVQVEAPEGSDVMLEMQYADLDEPTRQKHPDAKKIVIEKGGAFNPDQDQKRRDTFVREFQGAMGKVFSSDLLGLLALSPGEDRKGKLVLEVSSTIRREPTFYTYTNGGVFAGFLFKVVVDWTFRMFDREGNLLYETSTTSGPDQELEIDSQPGDPDWAPYSVMMDSAYYNYAGEVVRKFGLPPQAPKKKFKFKEPG